MCLTTQAKSFLPIMPVPVRIPLATVSLNGLDTVFLNLEVMDKPFASENPPPLVPAMVLPIIE